MAKTKSNAQVLKIAEKYLGQGGSRFRKFCGLPSGSAWCNAFVDYVANEGGVSSLYFDGKKMTYCPTSMAWCRKNLAQIPIYLALPMDIIYFDWEPNNVPNHIGFVRQRVSDDRIRTIEGNTSGGIVAYKTRPSKYVCGIFRPHYRGSFKLGTLDIDGQFGYSSIANLQKALGIKPNGILGRKTVMNLQKRAGVKADGDWGIKTSKAVQKMCGVKADGAFGIKSVKALQKWINRQNKTAKETDPLKPWYDAMHEQLKWSKNQRYHFNEHPTVANSKTEGTCITFVAVSLQRIGLLPSGKYFYYHPDKHKISGNGANYVKEHKERFELFYPNKPLSELKLKKGDIVGYGNPGYHTMVFMGYKNGKAIYNSSGHSKNYLDPMPYYTKRNINMVVRIREVSK